MDWTTEQIDEFVLQRQRAQRNAYNAKHPEKVLQNRITSAGNLLRRCGFCVIEGDLPPLPWDLETQRALYAAGKGSDRRD